MGTDFPGASGGGGGSGGLASANYIVTDVGGLPGVINGRTGSSIGTYGNYALAVQAAMTAAGTNRALIWLDPRYVDAPTIDLTITKSYVTLYSGMRQSVGDVTWSNARVRFDKVIIDSTAATRNDVKLQGIAAHEFQLYGNVNSIHDVIYEECAAYPTDSTVTHAWNFTGTGDVNMVHVNRCWIYDECTNGAIYINITGHPGAGQYYFNELHYKAHVGNCEMVRFAAGAGLDQVLSIHELDHVNVSQTGHVWVHFLDGSQDKGVKILNSGFEEHKTATIFKMDAGHTAQSQRHNLEFSHNTGTLAGSGDGAGTLSIIDNSATNTDYGSGVMSYLQGHGNKFLSTYASGTMQNGTTGATTRFIYDVGYSYYNIYTETNVVQTKG